MEYHCIDCMQGNGARFFWLNARRELWKQMFHESTDARKEEEKQLSDECGYESKAAQRSDQVELLNNRSEETKKNKSTCSQQRNEQNSLKVDVQKMFLELL